VNIEAMLSTRNVADIRDKVEVWQRKLLLISEIVEEWLTC